MLARVGFWPGLGFTVSIGIGMSGKKVRATMFGGNFHVWRDCQFDSLLSYTIPYPAPGLPAPCSLDIDNFFFFQKLIRRGGGVLHQEDHILVSVFSYLFTGFQVFGNLEISKPGNLHNGVQ